MNSKRIEWIDIAKGIGMICVQIGHIYFPLILKSWIYTFHMPLFFVLSGVTFSGHKYDTKDFIIRKVKTILVPYYIFSVLSLCLDNVLSLIKHDNINIEENIFGILFNYRKISAPMWFLMCLFVSEIAFYFIKKFFKVNSIRKNLIVIGICLAVTILNLVTINQALPFSADLVPMAIVFMSVGGILKDNAGKIKQISWMITAVLLVINIVFGYLNYKIYSQRVDMVVAQYNNILLFIISAIAGTVVVFKVAMLCEKMPQKIKTFLLFIGCNSIVYYGLHVSVNSFVDRVLSVILPRYCMNNIMTVISAIILLIVTFLCIAICVPLYSKIMKRR